MDYQTILVEEKNAVGYLTLNRPKQLNSFNEAMHKEVSSVLKAWSKDSSIRAVVLSAEGRGFCAGQDLGDRVVDPNADSPDLGLSIETYYNPLIKPIARARPTTRGKNHVPPESGTSPRRQNAWINEADLAAKTKSQAKAMFAPAPAATPLTAQMTGFGIVVISLIRGL